LTNVFYIGSFEVSTEKSRSTGRLLCRTV